MSGPEGSGGQAAHEGQSGRDAQFQSARDAQFESARDAQWQPRSTGQDPNAGGYPPAPGQLVNPYQPGPGTGSADAASTGSGQAAGGQQGSGQYGSGQYGAGQYGSGQYGAGQSGSGSYGVSSYGAGQYGNEQNAPAGGYQQGGYPPGGHSSGGPGGDRSPAGPAAAGNPGNPYPPPPAWGQGNPVVPDQFQAGHYPPGTPPGELRQQRRSARSVNPEKALGVAVAVLGGLNFVFGFLPQYTGGSTTGNFSVYAVGPGYVPILLLIAGLLALAAFVPGSERSRLAVAAVSVGGAVGAVIAIGTTSPGTASLGTGMGAILLTVFGIVQAVIAIGGYVVGTGIAPRSAGSSAPDNAGPGAVRFPSAPSAQATPADPGTGGTWAGPQGAGPGWPGVMPGQPPGPAEDQRGAPGNSWQASGQRPDQPQWQAGQPYAQQAPADQPYGSPSGPAQPYAAGTYAIPPSGQSSAGETYGRSAYQQPNADRSVSSPTYAGSHAGESYFGQAPSAGQYRTAEPAPGSPLPSHFDLEPTTGPQPAVGVGLPWSSSAADNDASRQTGSHRQDPENRDLRRTDSESDVVNLAKPSEPPPTAR